MRYLMQYAAHHARDSARCSGLISFLVYRHLQKSNLLPKADLSEQLAFQKVFLLPGYINDLGQDKDCGETIP